ncbi:flagellar hook-associated protein FlgK [Pseudogemmobacter faecipullorum]|uniref:Flagellar hook-associated protein 1 n=1 Tax=Pseudogemmobacter faecipullorum TaxID=2755041 RepID=A0ABS8CNA6_9RHOB|nr:flagellar hook-associated protein FlgK [Pseudogemmobacter faecipullorum]MCB5410858.1 flagellar hook-associated protein FlgK [Pseudogemmobacter faecipullorum]
MGISSAFNIATAGLRTTALQSDLVARNISNASTEGYTRKSADLVTRHGTVAVAGISREVNSLLDRLDRGNRSELARSQTLAEGLKSYTDLLGQPDDATSPSAGLNEVYNALITLSGSPNNQAAQQGTVEMAKGLARQINDLAQVANALSSEVDLNIRYDVSDLNDRLTRIGQINMRLMQTGSGGVEGAELLDEMGRLLDQVSGYMDIQITSSPDGAVSVYTAGGTELVQGRRVSTLSYEPGTGSLRAGDTDITPGRNGNRGFSSGSLAGLMELRDTAIPKIRGELDGFAADLIARFSAADPTLAPGAHGLFTDSALGTPGLDSSGLAARLMVNRAADPALGGNAGLLVSGFGTATTLEPGSSTIVNALISSIDQRPAGGQSLAERAANMVAGQQQMRVSAERAVQSAELSGATISASRQNLQGVNVDDELQVLMVIEQSYAANAKVLSTLQQMLDSLMDAV